MKKKKKMPKQKPGKSEQDVGTPIRFLDAVRELLRIQQFSVDLAASSTNHVCEPYITKEQDSFQQAWHQLTGHNCGFGWGWLNPEYADIYPWVQKAWEESRLGAYVAVLVPAAVGAQWWHDYVRGKGYAIMLRSRIQFIGHTAGYPKDLALILYAPYLAGGETTWRWILGRDALGK